MSSGRPALNLVRSTVSLSLSLSLSKLDFSIFTLFLLKLSLWSSILKARCFEFFRYICQRIYSKNLSL
jgi:hypothetical protein